MSARPVPEIRPFRALRFERETVGDLATVVAPPYDVIKPAEHQALLLRNPRNIVRLDLPSDEQGDEPGDKYRRAARTLAAWRSDGTFRKDPKPSIYVYEQTYIVPGTDVERTQRGFFARLRLEPFGPGSSVLPHERTLSGPKEDRYLLLRATGVNTSPVVGLYEDPEGAAGPLFEQLTQATPDLDVVDDDGVRHRLWVAPAGDADAEGSAAAAAQLLALARSGPTLIADGHHRYETALRYRDERRMTRSCEEDPAFDYLLMLFLPTSEALTVLPTHRIARQLADGGSGLLARAGELFTVTPADREALLASFGPAAFAPGGRGRIGLWTREGGAILTPLASGASDTAGSSAGDAAAPTILDVAVVQSALARLCGIDADAIAAGRLAYTRSAAEAMDAVDQHVDGADATFLLEPTPIAQIASTARAGQVLPQKSTYFYPKALSGLLVNPLEW
jgi:uncharacterized protein (DUF1015 family)